MTTLAESTLDPMGIALDTWKELEATRGAHAETAKAAHDKLGHAGDWDGCEEQFCVGVKESMLGARGM